MEWVFSLFLSLLFQPHVGPHPTHPWLLYTCEPPQRGWLLGVDYMGSSIVVKRLWQTISGFFFCVCVELSHVVTLKMKKSITSERMSMLTSPGFRRPVASMKTKRMGWFIMCLGLSFGGLTDLKSTINKKKFWPEMEAYPDTSLSK